jgi:hypothetical protein
MLLCPRLDLERTRVRLPWRRRRRSSEEYGTRTEEDSWSRVSLCSVCVLLWCSELDCPVSYWKRSVQPLKTKINLSLLSLRYPPFRACACVCSKFSRQQGDIMNEQTRKQAARALNRHIMRVSLSLTAHLNSQNDVNAALRQPVAAHHVQRCDGFSFFLLFFRFFFGISGTGSGVPDTFSCLARISSDAYRRSCLAIFASRSYT